MLHVRPDHGGTGAVRHVPLQLDPPAVGQRLEDVGGGVLVHAHHLRAAGLNSPESAVARGLGLSGRGRVGGMAPAAGLAQQEQDGQ